MIVLNPTDILFGYASTAALVDFSIHGVVSENLIQMANGQLGTSGTIHTGTAGTATGIQSIILVNTDTYSQTVNLALAGTSGTRYLIPKNLSLSPGASLHFEGGKSMVMGPSGNILYAGTSGSSGTSGIPTTIGGIATIDFGSTDTDEGSVVVTGIAAMTATANVFAFIQEDDTTADNTAEDHKVLGFFAKCTVSNRIVGVGFTINVRLEAGYARGTYKVHYIYVL